MWCGYSPGFRYRTWYEIHFNETNRKYDAIFIQLMDSNTCHSHEYQTPKSIQKWTSIFTLLFNYSYLIFSLIINNGILLCMCLCSLCLSCLIIQEIIKCFLSNCNFIYLPYSFSSQMVQWRVCVRHELKARSMRSVVKRQKLKLNHQRHVWPIHYR